MELPDRTDGLAKCAPFRTQSYHTAARPRLAERRRGDSGASPEPRDKTRMNLQTTVARREADTIRRKQRFRARLRTLGFASYGDYLSSPHWQDVRRRYLASGLWKGRCHGCRASIQNPDIHHRTYIRLGHEKLHDLRGVCHACHRAIHEAEQSATKPSLWMSTARTLKRARRRKMVTSSAGGDTRTTPGPRRAKVSNRRGRPSTN